MSRSLRLRLLVGTSTATAVILGLLGVSIFVAMRRSLALEFDTELRTKATAVAGMAEQNGHRVTFEPDYLQMDEFTRSPTPEFFYACLGDGSFLAASPTLKGRTLAPDQTSGAPVYRNLTLPNGRSGRAITLSFVPRFELEPGDSPPSAPPVMRDAVVILARDTGPLDATLSRLRFLLVGLCSLAIVISGLVLLLIVSRTMKPVRRVARRIESLGETDLSSRLELEDVPSELTPVVDRLNDLLARLQQAFARERSFTADVAHELRTPLSGLHTTLQVCRTRPREQREYELAIDKCLKITCGMHATVEALLLLARADAGQLLVEHQQIDLSQLIDETWSAFQSRATEHGVHVTIGLPHEILIESDAQKVRLVLNNLLDNAVSHCDDKGMIRIEADAAPDGVCVQISNSAAGFRQEAIEKLFDRFWRGDAARTQTGGHCGLGLSICHRLVNLLGGRISAHFGDGIFRVELFIASRTIARNLELLPQKTRDQRAVS